MTDLRVRRLCPRRKSVFGEVDAPPHITLQNRQGRVQFASSVGPPVFVEYLSAWALRRTLFNRVHMRAVGCEGRIDVKPPKFLPCPNEFCRLRAGPGVAADK